jgi:hypothetical protein
LSRYCQEITDVRGMIMKIMAKQATNKVSYLMDNALKLEGRL